MALIIVNALSLRPGGGLQVITGLLTRFDVSNHYQVLWSDPGSYAFMSERLKDKKNISFVQAIQKTDNLSVFLWQMRKLKHYLKVNKADLLLSVNHHFPTGSVPQVIYHLTVLRFERPKMLPFSISEIADRLRDWRTRQSLRLAAANVFESRFLLAKAASVRAKISNPKVIYIGLENGAKKTTKDPNVNRDPVIIALTSPQPHKDNPTLICVLARLIELRPDIKWRLKIAGGRSPDAFADLIHLAEELGISENIEWLGFLSHEDLQKIGHKCLCLVSTSKVESFNMVAVEAMSWPCATIVANTSSMPESVGDAGLLAKPGDAFDFADKVLMLWDDRDLMRDILNKGMTHSRRMTWANAANEFEDIFKELVD